MCNYLIKYPAKAAVNDVLTVKISGADFCNITYASGSAYNMSKINATGSLTDPMKINFYYPNVVYLTVTATS